jgi:hypothetical protein
MDLLKGTPSKMKKEDLVVLYLKALNEVRLLILSEIAKTG